LTVLYCSNRGTEIEEIHTWARAAPEGKLRDLAVWSAKHVPIGHLTRAVRFQRWHNAEGHGTGCYLLGLGPKPYWYFFPLTLCLKLGLPLLLLGGWLLLRRPSALGSWAFLAALAMLFASLLSRIQLGIRLVLPVVALGLVGLAVGWVRACPIAGSAR